MAWKWFELSPDGGAAGSTAADVFVNRAVEQVVARETIQNSWDASRRYLQVDRNHLCFVKFRFVSLTGTAKTEIVDALDLHELRDRVDLDPHLRRDVSGGTWIDAVTGDAPLRVLYVSDYGPHGLFGHPRLTRRSPLWLAMRATAVSDKRDQAGQVSGGSFGLGKGAMLHASHAGILVAHSRFDPDDDDPVTRRLEGAARWPDHAFGDQEWTGQARFGVGDDADPFEDDDADVFAARLGIPGRNDPAELPFDGANPRGTTFMIVDPRLDPRRLRPAIEEFWWPALASGEYDRNLLIEVEIDGETDNPGFRDERRRDDLDPYLRALDLARGRAEPAGIHEQRVDLRDPTIGELGSLGLVMLETEADEEGAGEDEPETLHTQRGAVVAFTRSPRMVVQYYTRNTRRNIRGVFVADPDRDEDLRACEPPTHDHWRGDRGAGGSDLGRKIEDRVNRALREFARDARPPRPRGEARIPALDRWLGHFGGVGTGSGEGASRAFLIQGPDGQAIKVEPIHSPMDPPDTVRAHVTFRVAVNPNAKVEDDELTATITVHARPLDEDDRVIRDLDVVDGEFTRRPRWFDHVRDGVLRGKLTLDWADFQWESDPYERDSRLGCAVEVEY